jgi:hypothetical protein
MYQKTKFARLLLDRRIAHYSGTAQTFETAVVSSGQQAFWKAKAVALSAVTKIAG